MSFINALPGAIAQGLVWAVMAIGVYITFRILDIADLTVDGSFATGGAVLAIYVTNSDGSMGSVFVGMLLALVAGLIAGLVTGIFHTRLGIPPILSGILTQLMLWSINLKIMGGKANVSVSASQYDVLVKLRDAGDSIWKLLVIVFFIILLLYLFFGTELGSAIRATGNNLKMSRAQGINVNLNKVIGLMLSNGLVALAGALLTQYQGFADINMGRGAIVIGLAAVVIGEAIFSKIVKNFALRLASVGFGAVLYFIVYQLVISLGMDTDLMKMLSAIVVAIFLGIPYLKKKYFDSGVKTKKEPKNPTGGEENA